MEALKLNKFLETLDNFSANEKEYISEIINKQLSEESRKKIIKRVKVIRVLQKSLYTKKSYKSK